MNRQKILIVDDSELVLTQARDALGEAGYDVLTASNGISIHQCRDSHQRPGDLGQLNVQG